MWKPHHYTPNPVRQRRNFFSCRILVRLSGLRHSKIWVSEPAVASWISLGEVAKILYSVVHNNSNSTVPFRLKRKQPIKGVALQKWLKSVTKLQTASSTLQLQHDLAIQRQQPDGSARSDPRQENSRSTIPHAFCRQYKRRLSSVNHLSWNNHDLTSFRSASRTSSQKFRSSGRPNQQLAKKWTKLVPKL